MTGPRDLGARKRYDHEVAVAHTRCIGHFEDRFAWASPSQQESGAATWKRRRTREFLGKEGLGGSFLVR